MENYDYITGRRRRRKFTANEKKNLKKILLTFSGAVVAGLAVGGVLLFAAL